MQNTQELIYFLRNAPHQERIKQLLSLGKKALEDTTIKQALADLWSGDAFLRRCALISCFTSRDTDLILRGISDASRSVRGLALRLAPKLCSDAEIVEALELAQQRRQHMPIIRELARRKRTKPLDQFVEKLAEKNDASLSWFLSYASKEVVQKLFQRALSQPSVLFWRRFALRHADLLAVYFIERLKAATELPDPRLRWDLNAALPAIIQRAPLQAFEILSFGFKLNIPEVKSYLPMLVKSHPQETYQWLERNNLSFHSVSFGEVALRLTHEQLIRLLRDYRSALGDPKQWFTKELAQFSKQRAKENFIKYWMLARPDVIDAWLEKQHTLPQWGAWFFSYVPAEKKQARDQAYERWSVASRDKFGMIQPHTLATLPWELREREARRHITEVGKLQSQPILRLQYYPLLPWVEALEHLKPWLSHPEPEIRIQAMNVFLHTFGSRMQGGAATELEIGEALELVKSRRFEQDPVRLVMLQALASWPRACWRPSHVSTLGDICQAALDASDLSHTTATHLGALLKNIFVLDQARAIKWYLQLYHNRGHIDANIGVSFTKEEVAAIAPGLLQIANRFVERGAHGLMLTLARSLQEKIVSVHGLDEVLTQELLRSQDHSAATILLVYFRDKFDGSINEAFKLCKTKETKLSLLTHCLKLCPKKTLDGVLLQLAAEALYNKKWWDHASVILGCFAAHVERAQVIAHIKQLQESERELPPKEAHFDSIFVSFLSGHKFFLQEEEVSKIAIDLYQQTNAAGHAQSICAALYEVRPEMFRELAPTWLHKDPSAALLPTMYSFLDRERHDMLLPFVNGAIPRGRFTPSKMSAWIFPVQQYARYWAPEVQEALATSIDREMRDEKKSIPELIGLVERRMGLPFASAAGIFPFAEDSRNALKEKVIRLIARLDAGQGVPTLLDCMGDDRARYAIYGFRKAILEMPAVAVIDLLKNTPLKKVTVAKEVMRLLGEMRSDEAFALMLSLHKTQKLHRDVRIAQLRALWDHLERPQAWEVFEDAVKDPDWILASKLSELPLAQLTNISEKKMSALFARLLERPEPEARVALLQKMAQLPLVDAKRSLYQACLRCCSSEFSDEFLAAIQAVLARARTQDAASVARFFGELLPKRRQFFAAFQVLLSALNKSNQAIQEIGRGLLDIIAQDPLVTRERLQLAAKLCSWAELVPLILSLEQRQLLTVDTFDDAARLMSSATREQASKTEETFRAHASPLIRRLGLTLLCELSQTGHGWISSRRALLELYQRDSAPMVASAAVRIFPEEK